MGKLKIMLQTGQECLEVLMEHIPMKENGMMTILQGMELKKQPNQSMKGYLKKGKRMEEGSSHSRINKLFMKENLRITKLQEKELCM